MTADLPVLGPNQAAFKAAARAVLDKFGPDLDLSQLDDSSYHCSDERVQSAIRSFELALVDAAVPVVRSEVLAGRLTLEVGGDYLTMSARLIEHIVVEWIQRQQFS